MSNNKPLLLDVPIDAIWWDLRFRDDVGDVSGLAEAILEKGLIQPISVTDQAEPDGVGTYKLLAGERRYRAHLLLVERGHKEFATIRTIVRTTEGEADEREIELYENVFRKDFTWDERVKLIDEIDKLNKAKNSNWSIRKTAEYLGCGVATVSRQTQLAKALTIMPELADEAKTEADAYKILKKLEERHTNEILRERVQERTSREDYDFLQIADANYRKGDCFHGLEHMKDNGLIHFIECDPPYGIDLNNMKKVEGPTSTVESYQEVPINEYAEFMNDLCSELYRVANQNCWMIMWYGPSNYDIVKGACVAAGWQVNDIPAIWAKPSGQTMQPSTNLANCYEPFFICKKGNPVLSKQGRSNVFSFSPVHGPKKYHPTERPIQLMTEILETFSHIGAIVLVPFLGSGVTLRACYLTGRSGFGWDLNGEYKDKFLLAVEDDLHKLNGETESEED